MKRLLFLGIVAVLAGGCSVLHPKVQGSGKVTTRSVEVGKEVKAFKHLETQGAFDVVVRQGEQSELKITGDDNIVSMVRFSNDGDKLLIDVEKDYSSSNKLKVEVTIPEVTGLTINGSGTGELSNVKGNALELKINGSGEIKANGEVQSLNVSISGSAEIDATALKANDVDASIAGSGSIRTFAEKKLDASISGSGEIRYKGQPDVKQSIAGSGEVSQL